MKTQLKTIFLTLTILLVIFANIQLHINPVFAVNDEALITSYSIDNMSGAWPCKSLHPSDNVNASAQAQCFTVCASNTNLTKVSFYLKRSGYPLGKAYAVLYEITGSYGSEAIPTGTALATSDDFDVSTLTAGYVLYNFTFTGDQQYEMQANTYYYIAYENPATGTIDSTNYVAVAADVSSSTYDGNMARFYAGVWDARSADDLIFYVYGITTLHVFSISSVPTNITFTIDGESETTAYSENRIANETYTVVFPETHVVGTLTWNFNHYEDGSTNRTRLYELTSNATLTAYYQSEYTPINYTGYNAVFESAMNNMFELNGILEGNDTYRQMLLDTSIYENHGKLYPLVHPYEGPELTWGRIGKGLEFDGVDDSVIITSSESLNVTDAITIEFWFMVYNATPNQKFISKSNGTGHEWIIGIWDSKLYTELWTDSGTLYSDLTSSDTIEAGVFYYFSLTYDYRDGYYTVYLHGTPAFNVTTDGNKIRNLDANLYLGNLANSSYWFNGVIDEIRIFPYKRNYDEIYSDAREPIKRFDTWTFVNSGISDDGESWTVVEGTTNGYQGFKNNDPELPWTNATGNYNYTFVRTIKYVAGFQQYQLYCNVKFDSTYYVSGLDVTENQVSWYWSFFKNGRLQVTYDILIQPHEWVLTRVERWYFRFRRTTPYLGTEVMVDNYVDTNYTLFPTSIPLIVSAWVGADNKHFTMRIDSQDERLVVDSTAPMPFVYSFDLIDEDGNTHIVDWFDGWLIQGIKVRAHEIYEGQVNPYDDVMEIESHKMNWLIPVLVFLSPIIGGIAAYYLYPQVQTVVHTVVQEVVNVLQPIAEVVGTAVKIVGEATADAIAGLAHDIIGGLSGLGALFSDLFAGFGNILGDLATSIWASLSGFSTPILTALVLAAAGMGPLLITLIDGAFMIFGYPEAFSTFLNFISGLWTWVISSVPYAVSMLNSWFTLMASFIGKMLNTITIGAGIWADMIGKFWNVIDGAYGWSVNSYTTLRIDLWIQIGLILYPIFLLYKWEEEGLDAVIGHLKMLLDIGAFFARTFITVIQLFINIISHLIEKIPVVE